MAELVEKFSITGVRQRRGMAPEADALGRVATAGEAIHTCEDLRRCRMGYDRIEVRDLSDGSILNDTKLTQLYLHEQKRSTAT